MTEQPILCSPCFDEMASHVMEIIPQSTCERCGKKCLGYKAGALLSLFAASRESSKEG